METDQDGEKRVEQSMDGLEQCRQRITELEAMEAQRKQEVEI